MHINVIFAAASVLILFSSPTSVARCVRGPKHAGDECESQNIGSLTCGPGANGNIVSNLVPQFASSLSTSLYLTF
jgi:hypothetical protein